MKKLALLAIVTVLCGGAAFAQQDMGNAAVEGATYTTGIVQSINANSMTVLEDSGREVSVLLDDATVGGITPAVGARVRVDYRLNASNQAVAETIQLAPQDAATEETSAAAAAPAVSAPAAEPSPSSEVAAPVAEPAPADVPSAAASQDLPRTASELPLLALTALLGIAGAVTLRATR
jgi:hypothetical protein